MSARTWWTDQRVARLREKLGSGASARETALELGCSRNAVLAKARSLEAAGGSRIPRNAKAQSGPRGVLRQDGPDVRLLDEIEALPVVAGVRLRDLRARHCRWVAEPGAPWVFCGESVVCGSYCATHAELVYVNYPEGGVR